ncbi:hypothetical protein ACWCPI_01260 [Streptomyces sp. NPDC001920]
MGGRHQWVDHLGLDVHGQFPDPGGAQLAAPRVLERLGQVQGVRAGEDRAEDGCGRWRRPASG